MAKRRAADRGRSSPSGPPADLGKLLGTEFVAKHVGPALLHYNNAVHDYSRGDWEGCIAKAGKFVEALLKALAVHCGVTFETGRKFQANKLILGLSQLPHGGFDDCLRLLMPRGCQLVYDIASNRGARHDPDEVSPNSMDANMVMPVMSWLLAEAVRFAQKGSVDPDTAARTVESLTERRYSAVEKVDGRVYLHAAKKSAVEVALVILADGYPKRIAPADLIEAVKRNGFTQNNASQALARISQFLDVDDSTGELRLLSTGLRRAEEIIRLASATN